MTNYFEHEATDCPKLAEGAWRHICRGVLKKLREQADRDPAAERNLLKEFKGIGDVGVDIFFREAQAIWDELYPFADKRALQGASKLGLAKEAAALAKLVPRKQFPRLVAALVRITLEKKTALALPKAGRKNLQVKGSVAVR